MVLPAKVLINHSLYCSLFHYAHPKMIQYVMTVNLSCTARKNFIFRYNDLDHKIVLYETAAIILRSTQEFTSVNNFPSRLVLSSEPKNVK